jgi:Glycosyl transferase family 2
VAATKPILGVIIPAYNEERSVAQVIRRVLLEPSVLEVVVVHDCSTDGTLAAARLSTDPRVTIKHHEVMETGFKVMRTSLMRRLGLRGTRFDIEPEITGRILRLGYRIYEVPIDYAARSREQGKKLTWRNGVKALFVLMRIRLSTSKELFGTTDPYHEARLNELSLSPSLRLSAAEPTGETRTPPD